MTRKKKAPEPVPVAALVVHARHRDGRILRASLVRAEVVPGDRRRRVWTTFTDAGLDGTAALDVVLPWGRDPFRR